MKLSNKAEEILEALWIATEEEGDTAASFDLLRIDGDCDALRELEQRAWVEVRGERVALRPEG